MTSDWVTMGMTIFDPVKNVADTPILEVYNKYILSLNCRVLKSLIKDYTLSAQRTAFYSNMKSSALFFHSKYVGACLASKLATSVTVLFYFWLLNWPVVILI